MQFVFNLTTRKRISVVCFLQQLLSTSNKLFLTPNLHSKKMCLTSKYCWSSKPLHDAMFCHIRSQEFHAGRKFKLIFISPSSVYLKSANLDSFNSISDFSNTKKNQKGEKFKTRKFWCSSPNIKKWEKESLLVMWTPHTGSCPRKLFVCFKQKAQWREDFNFFPAKLLHPLKGETQEIFVASICFCKAKEKTAWTTVFLLLLQKKKKKRKKLKQEEVGTLSCLTGKVFSSKRSFRKGFIRLAGISTVAPTIE